MANNRSGSFLGGLLVGGTLGAVAGLLVAPRSGRETRYFIRKSADALPELAEDLSTSLQLQADRLSESAIRSWDGTLVRLQTAIAAGLEATQQTRQQLEQNPTAKSARPARSLRSRVELNPSEGSPNGQKQPRTSLDELPYGQVRRIDNSGPN